MAPEQIESAKDYFAKRNLDPGISKNTFTTREAIAILEKAVADLKAARLKEETVKKILNQAWGIFKVLA